MARRKGISSNTNKARGGVAVAVALAAVAPLAPRGPAMPAFASHPHPHQHHQINHHDDHSENSVPALPDKSREEFHSISNQSRYLHKKFKKLATVVQPMPENGHKVDVFQKLSVLPCGGQSSPRDPAEGSTLPATMSTQQGASLDLTPNHTSPANDASSMLTWHSSTEIDGTGLIRKDYDERASVVKECSSYSGNTETTNVNGFASKKFESGEYREACESNSKDASGSGGGRHVCPYCKLNCAKPSVLQKHIRAHTNERPYPCIPCGFAFKTKSNLYKHCRSRSHALRLQGTEEIPNTEEDWSLGSEADLPGTSNSRPESTWSSDKGSVQGDSIGMNDSSPPDLEGTDCVSPSNMMTGFTDCRPKPIIYKPKFHKAAYYQEEEESPRSVLSPNPEFLNRHISKIISDNEAIVDTLDSPLHRRYSKDNINQKHLNEMISIQDSLNCENQPLNLTKNSESEEANHRKRCCSESFAQPESLKGQLHPLNPEGSIIKDLLLKARAQESGLLPVTSEDYDASETLYICPLCNIRYRSAENLEIHTLYYCKGNIVSSNSMLNGLRDPKFSKPEHGYVRSNSVHVTLPETYNPNSLVKLASTTLKSPLERGNKPENIVIHKNDFHETVAPLPSPGPLLGNTRLIDTNNSMDTPKSAVMMNSVPCSPIPSLKRHTESQSSDYFCRFPKLNEDRLHTSEVYSPPTKIRRVETPTTLRSLEELSLSPMRQNSTSLQMFGGEVKIMDNAGGTMTMRIDTITSQQSSTVLSQSAASPKLQGPETSNIVVRSGLHSGGTIVHNPPTPKEPLPSPHPQTPRLLVSMAPNITTPNLTVSGITGPNMTKFQFPPSESLSAYNLLTLPPISPAASPNAPATIFHAGKLIPYVPGMPGPNSLNNHMPTMFNMLNTMQVYKKTPDNITTKDDRKMTNDRITLDASTSEDLKSKTLPPRSKLRTQNHPIFNYTKDKFDASVKINSDLNPKTILVNNSSPKENVPIIKIQYEDSHLSSGSKRLNMPGNKLDLIFQNKNKNIVDFSPQKLVREDLPRLSLTKPDKMCEYNNSEKENASVPIIEKKILSRSEYRQFNFENLISKSEILNKSLEVSTCEMPSTSENCIKSDEKKSERSETSYFKKSVNSLAESSKNDVQKVKFLRPTSLPLKPGTFVPKRHHGITPNANTLPLISPETPRPAKAYGQLYLNGHAYTYLGLKCSARVYYCTLNRPQPTYVPKQHALSMYSNWQVCSESAPHPLGLSPGNAMALYDSRHRPQNTTVAKIKHDHLMTHSSQWSATAAKQDSDSDGNEDAKTSGTDLGVSKCGKGVTGGFESNEEYTYVRGRGRGRYVCAECGIRCKKPSMLKKHIRTHTDVRPFTCKHCAFSFKTKGNLTKHMKSKAHYKKCCELGISPSEEVDNEEPSQDMGESEEDTESEDDGNEAETESSDTDSWKSRLEHEAAHCLLSLWGGRPAPGLLTSARPTTYPYSSTSETPTPCSSTAIPQQNPAHTDTTSSVIKKTSFTSKEDPEVRPNFFPLDQSKPMDLSKGDFSSASDILTPVGEPSLLVSLARSTSQLPQRRADWRDDEPMLQAYLTEKALQDSRIKQSQYTNGRPRQLDINAVLSDSLNLKSITTIDNTIMTQSSKVKTSCVISESPAVIVRAAIKLDVPIPQMQTSQLQTSTESSAIETLAEIAASSMRLSTPPLTVSSEKITTTAATSESSVNTDNAKFVASEYLKVVSAKSNIETDNSHLGNASDKLSEKLSKEASSHLNSNDGNISNEKDSEVAKLNPDSIGVARKVVVGAGGLGFKLTAPSGEYSSAVTFAKGHLTEDGRSVCVVCNKTFSKPSQLRLHINIHYMERPFRCSACAVSFRTRGHLQKHERSGSHHNKVSMTSTFGAATTTNPRPFKCSDCGIAFRIHGHLAKHLRSKMHVMRLECLGKLPFGTFAEIERAGVSLTDIDTTDCDNSLASLQILAQKLHEKDPTKLEKWDPTTMAPPLLPPGADSSDEEEQDTDPTSPNDHITPSPSCEPRTIHDSDSTDEVHVNHSATDT